MVIQNQDASIVVEICIVDNGETRDDGRRDALSLQTIHDLGADVEFPEAGRLLHLDYVRLLTATFRLVIRQVYLSVGATGDLLAHRYDVVKSDDCAF